MRYLHQINATTTHKERKPTKKKNERGEVKTDADLSWINSSYLGEKLTSQLLELKDAYRSENGYYVKLFAGTGNPEFKHEKPYANLKFPDAGYRLLSLFRYWNIIQYFFPYKNLIEENWNGVLKEFIPNFISATSEIEYKKTITKKRKELTNFKS